MTKNHVGATAEADQDRAEAAVEGAIPVHHGNGHLVDGLALWQAESVGAGGQVVPAIRLDENERLLVPFTTSMVRMYLHYLDSQLLRGYVHCLGTDCLLCRIGRTVEIRDLVPFYDLMERAVGVLPVSPNLRPNALRPQLLPVIKRVGADAKPFLVTVKKNGASSFVVATASLPAGADDGATVIAQFQAAINSGAIDLSSAFQRVDNSVLQEIPEIATAMAAKGIPPCSVETSQE